MELQRFSIKSQCVASDDELYANIAANLERKLPVLGQYAAHDGVAVMVGSGPSVMQYVNEIKYVGKSDASIVALKDAHDWLLDNDIIPQFAVAIDPQESRANVFHRPHPSVEYLVGSQVHPSMLDNLEGYDVKLWHLYIRQGQAVPPSGTPLIAGGTTTGLRAITLLYTLGFRKFVLYGYDSCLKDGVLRMNGDKPRPGDDTVNEIVVDGRLFYCNPSMTAQANEFQNLFWSMPDIQIESHGDGLITAILEARKKAPKTTVSFIHHWGPGSASYRYRAAMPAAELGATINDAQTANVVIYAKPDGIDSMDVKRALGDGKRVIADFCDDHFDRKDYRDMLRLADEVACSTKYMAEKILNLGRTAHIIPDPYEYPQAEPHCTAEGKLLWFGHGSNIESIERVTVGYPVAMVSNAIGCIPWSRETMLKELAAADIVLMPATAPYKSCNRTVEAVRQGCFVVAEPHPSLEGFPGIWIGDIKEGIEWARLHPQQANERTALAQTYVSQTYSPRTVAFAWSRVIQGLAST